MPRLTNKQILANKARVIRDRFNKLSDDFDILGAAIRDYLDTADNFNCRRKPPTSKYSLPSALQTPVIGVKKRRTRNSQ